jgi:4-hydroxybenzoate polyprenyltransferase
MASDPEHWTDAADRRVTRRRSATDPIRRLVGTAWRILEYSSAYLALVGAAEALIVTYLLSLSPSPAPAVIALVTFAVYANDRLVDLETDSTSSPRRMAFVDRHSEALYVLAAVSYGLAAALSALGGPLAFGITLLPGAAWLVYAIDWVDLSSVRFDRAKEIPVVSSLIVSGAWAMAVVLLPVAFADRVMTPAGGVLFVYFLLAAFVSAEVANVRDVESDARNGIATMVTFLGVARSRIALWAVSLIAATLPAVAAVRGIVTPATAAILALGIVPLFAVVALLGRAGDGGGLTIAAECTRVPAFVALTALAFL